MPVFCRGMVDAFQKGDEVFPGELFTMVSDEHGYQTPAFGFVPNFPIVQYGIKRLSVHVMPCRFLITETGNWCSAKDLTLFLLGNG